MADDIFKKDKNKNINNRPNDDEDVVTFLYDVRKPMEFINEGEHGVFDITKQTGINTAKSVFDRTTKFRT